MRKVFVMGLLLLPMLASAAELEIGAKAPGFTLVNAVDGKSHTFRPGDGKVSVVVFTCNQCPYARAFESRLVAIGKQYNAKGVAFYAVNPNDEQRFAEENIENMKARATANGWPYPYLKDSGSDVARAYGARVTPHVFVVDGEGILRYRGYIDDSAKPEQRTKTALTDALDAMLSSGQIAEGVTREFGCTIKWKS